MALIAIGSLVTYAQDLTGVWSGTLRVMPQMSLRLVFHLAGESTSLDSPDQGAYDIPAEIAYISADSVSVRIPGLMASYTGSLRGDSLCGMFSQRGLLLPLNLRRGVSVPNRPQTPQPPYPYSTEDLSIPTGDATLTGTLTIPAGADSSTPLVVMVSGSGQQDRDESLFDHRPFAVIADYLARNGIASFRYDDRGMGGSTGDIESATTADFAKDAGSVADTLRRTGRFGRIGLLGHSEGGMIAYMLGTDSRKIDFLVSVAGPSVKGTKTLGYQNKMNLLRSGFPADVADDFSLAMERVLDYKINHPEAVAVTESLLATLYPQHSDTMMTRQLADSLSAVLSEKAGNPWMMYFVAYDPASDLSALAVPALIIYGDRDQQVPPSLNADLARELAPNAQVVTFPELNHLMQHARTGDPSEYRDLEETFSPEVLEAIASFILHSPSVN